VIQENQIKDQDNQSTKLDCPLVSIVVPSLNEEITIGLFVDWCKKGLKKAGINGQILIVDSSTDRTPEIAEEHGAEVLRVPKRGLGRAYIDAIPYINGKYVVMGDADLTYDFRELQPFINKFLEGYDFVMGSRFKGYIEPNSMPKLHRYFGTPLTTCMLNIIYGSHYSDIHCGMRGISLNALKEMDLKSQSWEYASEMVLKATKMRLKITEVPVRFYKDVEGRVSQHKRTGWFSPWIAGWINLKAMLLYAPDFFLLKPSIISFILGTVLTLSLAGGTYRIGPIELNLHWMLLGLTMSTLGYNGFQIASITRLYYKYDKEFNKVITKCFTYNRGVLLSVILFFTGFCLNIVLLCNWIKSELTLSNFYHPGIFGLLLMILGFQTFSFTLLVEIFNKDNTQS